MASNVETFQPRGRQLLPSLIFVLLLGDRAVDGSEIGASKASELKHLLGRQIRLEIRKIREHKPALFVFDRLCVCLICF